MAGGTDEPRGHGERGPQRAPECNAQAEESGTSGRGEKIAPVATGPPAGSKAFPRD